MIRAMFWCAFFAAITPLVASASVLAQIPTISRIEIRGLQRISPTLVRARIQSRVGDPPNVDVINSDLKSIYSIGLFSSVVSSTENFPSGVAIIFEVRERPEVTNVRVEGMKIIAPNDKKVTAAMNIHSGEIEDPLEIKTTIQRLENVYAERGYPKPNITVRTLWQPNNKAALEFDVVEAR